MEHPCLGAPAKKHTNSHKNQSPGKKNTNDHIPIQDSIRGLEAINILKLMLIIIKNFNSLRIISPMYNNSLKSGSNDECFYLHSKYKTSI